MAETSMLVIGAGPYGVAVAARAIERGIDTVVVGHPMAFWREQMPAGMFLRSGLDWHLDAAGVHTFAAFAEDRGLEAPQLDPVPIATFLAYADWFVERKGVRVRDTLVRALTRDERGFVAALEDGGQLTAERVVAAPGVAYFTNRPSFAEAMPESVDASHSCDLVRFDDLEGARVLVVGGRQSAYEWAALLVEHGAARVDIVHRHPAPRFARVSWSFLEPYLEATRTTPGWWRSLPADERAAIARRFWEVGRLTLEWWLPARLRGPRVRTFAGAEVTGLVARPDETAEVELSSGERLGTDRVVFATGYRAELSRVPYLEDLVPAIEIAEGFPILDETFETSVPGLYLTGFCATRDFGPFFGFTKACPAAAEIIVDALVRQA